MDELKRKEILRKFGTKEGEIEELLQYNKNCFDIDKLQALELPGLEDEPSAAVWQEYAEEAQQEGVFQTLKKYIVQLNFPISSGISNTDSYKAVTLKGKNVTHTPEATGLQLEYQENLQLTINQTVAGKISVLFTDHREDFKALVRALSMKNEPKTIPDAMGACLVKGLNNWDRVNRSGMLLSQLLPHKSLYQDTIIVLSGGSYSGVSAKTMGLPETDWQKLSLIIRREHECTHYVTQRLYGSARNRFLDELIADYIGIREAIGEYRADWFLKFIGLEHYPEYKKGARLENYKGNPPISHRSFTILQELAYHSAHSLEKLDIRWKNWSKEQRIKKLCTMTLEEIASINIDCF